MLLFARVHNSTAFKIIYVFFFALLRGLRYRVRRAAASVAGSNLIKRLPVQPLAYFIIIQDSVRDFFDELLFAARQSTLALFDGLVLAVDRAISLAVIAYEKIEYIALLCEFSLYCGNPLLAFFAVCVRGIIGVFYTCLIFIASAPLQIFSYYIVFSDLDGLELCIQISLFIFEFTAIFLIVAAFFV